MEGKEEEVGLTVEWGRKQGIVVRTRVLEGWNISDMGTNERGIGIRGGMSKEGTLVGEAKGKASSLNTTCRETYIRPVDKSRHK